MQVTQAAWTFLAVRFKAIRRVTELQVPLPGFQRLRNEKRLRVHRRIITFLHLAEQFPASRHKTGFKQACLDGDVIGGFLDAFCHRPDTVADCQTQRPQFLDERFQLRIQRIIRAVRQQHQHIDIRMGEQFTPAITADRHQRMP